MTEFSHEGAIIAELTDISQRLSGVFDDDNCLNAEFEDTGAFELASIFAQGMKRLLILLIESDSNDTDWFSASYLSLELGDNLISIKCFLKYLRRGDFGDDELLADARQFNNMLTEFGGTSKESRDLFESSIIKLYSAEFLSKVYDK